MQTDITVVGAGLAGVNAAIAAARLGCKVALVGNRPVLGGNSSSEVRVWVCGGTSHGTNRYARESGIMGELFLENQYRNPEGNPHIWDLVLLDAVYAEPNIRLFLNTDVHEVEASGGEDERIIHSVTGWMMGSERRIRFKSKMFLDCTGDGLVGFLAGAKYRLGREAREEFQEDWAPEAPDNITLGSTLLFYTKDAGQPVKFVPPSFAKDIMKTSIPERRIIQSGDNGCAYWWIEWGGETDTVHANEQIRDELWAVVYGIWDYIKNSGKFAAENMTLEWVGSVPGKREYRRFIGDYILNQNDILAQTPFHDRVAFGGWSIDLHPPQGVYATEGGSKHLYADGNYHIPFRSLYSANVSNLLFAGRDISATHVAFGTIRVMATCAILGEAAGTGAALSVQYGITPRELAQERVTELQQTLLRQDASVIGVRNEDAADLARQAGVSASSTLRQLAVESPAAPYPLTADAGLLIPLDGDHTGLELLIDAAADSILEVELYDTGRGENYVPANMKAAASVSVAAGSGQWVQVPLQWKPEEAQNAFVIIKANQALSLNLSEAYQPGVLIFSKGKTPVVSAVYGVHQPPQPVVQWSMHGLVRRSFCFRLQGDTQAYAPEKVVDGYARPYGGPHQWSSTPVVADSNEWLELAWAEPVSIRELYLTFNDDPNEDLINLHHHLTPFAVIPELVKDYRVEAWTGEEWVAVAEVTDNRKRKRLHQWEQAVKTERLRIAIQATNGAKHADIVEVRVYS